MYTGIWWGNLRERDHSEDLGVYIYITMDPLSSGMEEWTGWIWLRIGTGECDNEPSLSIKMRGIA